MRSISTLALAVAVAGMSVAAPALAKDKPPAVKYTPAVAKGYNDGRKALDAGDIAGATTDYQAAKAAAQNDDDRFVAGQLAVAIGQKSNNTAILGEGVDMMLASGKALPEQKAQLYDNQGRIAYAAKDYRKAEEAFAQAQQAGSKDEQLVPVLVQTMQLNGETLKALTTLNAAIDANVAANQPTPQEWYQRGLSIGFGAVKSNPADLPQITDATTQITKKWVAAYPTKSNWHDALLTYTSQVKASTDVQIDVFRLLRAAGALSGDSDYREYAEDVYLRYPNEAKSVLQEGSSKGILNLAGKNDASEVLGIVTGKTQADQASLPAADKSARASANGKGALTTADAYVSYGDYPKAIDLYKVAATKGGVDAGTVALHMGWAQALSGDAAGAKQTFATVTGVRKPIAEFWAVHLDHPTQG